ncbi:MAG: VWA domain-containing protein [Candidatus Odinarchaeota archaeon]
MFKTSSEYFPKEAKVLKDMPWVGRVSFADIKEKIEEIKTRPIMCSNCGGALTNPDIIQVSTTKGKTFQCEFCGTLNVIPKDLMPGTDLSEFVLGQLARAKPITEDTLLAVIDISGSMSGGKLAAVKESLIRTVTDLSVNAPETTFGLLAFHSDVYCYDENMKTIFTLSGDMRYSVDEITKAVEKKLKDVELKPLKKTKKKWVTNIGKLRDIDMTALGPAMVAGYVIMKDRGGRIILLTDGLANEGVGALEGSSTTGAQLYEDLAIKAANASIIIDVVGIKDPSAFMALEALAVMPMQTGGTMYYAQASEIADAMSESSRGKIVARGVKMRVIAPEDVEVAEVSGLGGAAADQLKAGIRIGSVTEDREVYVRLAPAKKVKEKEVPIQVQVSYMDDEGNQRMRVMTKRVKVTEDAKPIIETLDVELPATYAVQRAGEEQYRGEVAKSKKILENTQSAYRAVRNQAPAALAKAIAKADKVLDEEIAEAEQVAERQKEEMSKRSVVGVAQAAPIADEDAALSMQKARKSSKQLFEEEE